jgi:hypothetical protein
LHNATASRLSGGPKRMAPISERWGRRTGEGPNTSRRRGNGDPTEQRRAQL